MSGYGYVSSAVKESEDNSSKLFTIGKVVDTNDPQQMGRVRVECSGYGDLPSSKVNSLPWAMNVSPLGGVVDSGHRGPENGIEDENVIGHVAYGMWNVPKVGAYVLVGCVDGDSNNRFYVGCIHPQYMTHTMPHGRYLWNSPSTIGTPDGPFDSLEFPIEPLYANLTKQFTPVDNDIDGTPDTEARTSMEWLSRGADRQVSAFTNTAIFSPDNPGTVVADHQWGDVTTVSPEFGDSYTLSGVGYGESKQNTVADENVELTKGINYDSQVYSWTTPGFHSFSMDDHSDNSRIRIEQQPAIKSLWMTPTNVSISTPQEVIPGLNWIM